MSTNVFKKERSRYTIDPNSRMLRIYQFYVNMGGQYQRQLDRCNLLKAIIFKAPWYFFTRKKIVSDLTLAHLAVVTYLVGELGFLTIKNPKYMLIFVSILVLLYLLRNLIIAILEKIMHWYTSNKSYTIRSLKILATIGAMFGAGAYIYGVSKAWAFFKYLLITTGLSVCVVAVLIGVFILCIEANDRYEARKLRIRLLRREARMNNAVSGLDSAEVQHDSLLTMMWDQLKTIKNLYFCPLVDIPEGAIVPRDVSYS